MINFMKRLVLGWHWYPEKKNFETLVKIQKKL